MPYRFYLSFLLTLIGSAFSTVAIAQKAYKRSVIQQGIRVDLSLSQLNPGRPAGEFREGENVKITFRITDTLTGKGLTGVSPAAWMDREKSDQQADCGQKIISYLEGRLLSRPEINLNVYYVMTLNGDNTINVVNPLFGFGGSQLLSQIQLPAPGYDWVITENQNVVFVSVPDANQVAVINTVEMKNAGNITIPGRPGKLVLQTDEHFLWVTYDLPGNFENKSGIVVIDTEKRTVEKIIPTGKGPHDIIVDEGNKHVYVSNLNEGTISVIDMQSLGKIRDIEAKDGPGSMAWSVKARALYVVNTKNPVISVIDGKSGQIIKQINAEEGINKIFFAPGGRNAFVTNPKKNTVNIIDAATNRIVQTADVDLQPDQVSFTDELVYIRHLGSETIYMIPMDAIGKEGTPVIVADFPGGQNPPAQGSPECGAKGIVQPPGDNAVLISNYKDKSIYYYKEGMAAPMGSFNTYGKNPKAVLVVDKGIKEKANGEYETVAKLGAPGVYELALFIDVPSIVECFQIDVLPDSEK